MGTSIRKVADFVRQLDGDSSDETPAPSSNLEGSSRLGDELQGTLEDVSVDSVTAVREVRERE